MNAKSHALLAGLLYDETGDPLRLTHTGRKAKQYRYYVSIRFLNDANRLDGWRLPAHEIESAASGVVARLLLDRRRFSDALTKARYSQIEMPEIFEEAAFLATHIDDAHPQQKRSFVRGLLDRVEFRPDAIVVAFNTHFLLERLGIEGGGMTTIRVAEPASLRRRGVEAKLVIQSQESVERRVDPKCVRRLRRRGIGLRHLHQAKSAL